MTNERPGGGGGRQGPRGRRYVVAYKIVDRYNCINIRCGIINTNENDNNHNNNDNTIDYYKVETYKSN